MLLDSPEQLSRESIGIASYLITIPSGIPSGTYLQNLFGVFFYNFTFPSIGTMKIKMKVGNHNLTEE